MFSDNKRPESIEISSASSQPGTDQNSKTKSTEQEKQTHTRLSTSAAASNSEAKASTEIQKELHQEIRRRENAEDWAEFLTLELEAHIQAYMKAERQYKQLFLKLDPASKKILKGKLFRFFCKNKSTNRFAKSKLKYALDLTRNCEANDYRLDQQIIVAYSKLVQPI